MAYDRTLLTAQELQTFLAAHPQWRHEGGMLRRTWAWATPRSWSWAAHW